MKTVKFKKMISKHCYIWCMEFESLVNTKSITHNAQKSKTYYSYHKGIDFKVKPHGFIEFMCLSVCVVAFKCIEVSTIYISKIVRMSIKFYFSFFAVAAAAAEWILFEKNTGQVR